MSVFAILLGLCLQGLLVGAFARLALPGRDPMSIPQTIGIGLVGSLTAGLIAAAVTDGSVAPTFIVSLFFSVLLLYLIRRRRGGSLTDPGRPRRFQR